MFLSFCAIEMLLSIHQASPYLSPSLPLFRHSSDKHILHKVLSSSGLVDKVMQCVLVMTLLNIWLSVMIE